MPGAQAAEAPTAVRYVEQIADRGPNRGGQLGGDAQARQAALGVLRNVAAAPDGSARRLPFHVQEERELPPSGPGDDAGDGWTEVGRSSFIVVLNGGETCSVAAAAQQGGAFKAWGTKPGGVG